MQGDIEVHTATELTRFFADAVYPLLVTVTCFIVFTTAIFVAAKARTARAILAVVVPILSLPFIVMASETYGDPVTLLLAALYPSAKLLIGAAAAVVLIELGRRLLPTESELGPAMFILFMSAAGTFFVYALMRKAAALMFFVVFGFVIGGGFYMILRGVPVNERLLRGWPFGEWLWEAFRNRDELQRHRPPANRSARTGSTNPGAGSEPRS